MPLRYNLAITAWALLFTSSNGGTTSMGLGHGLSIRDPHAAIAQGLVEASMKRRDTNHSASVTLDTIWQDQPLFSIGGSRKDPSTNVTVGGSIAISCKTCYFKGSATAELTIDSDQNIGQIINQTINEVEAEIEMLANGTKTAIDEYINDVGFTNYTEQTLHNIEGDGLSVSDFLPPHLNVSFDMNLTAIPDTTVTFVFQDLDLYLELEALLNVSASYTISLYHSETPAGISLPNDLELGIVFSAELILSVDGYLDMTGGLHIKVDDHVALEIALFGDKVSGVELKGAQYELFPVQVQSAGVAFIATLRLGASAALTVGDALDLPDVSFGDFHLSNYHLGGGIQAAVFADVATFKTEVTANLAEDAQCELDVVQEYSFVLGADAGAQVTVGNLTYGPAASTSVAVFTTTMAGLCALMPTSTVLSVPTTTEVQRKRDRSDGDWTTTAVTTVITYSAVQCPPTVTGQCPVSLQSTLKSIETLSTTLSGSEEEMSSASYPTRTPTIIEPIPFGTNAKVLSSISGSPTPYTAKSTSASTSSTHGSGGNPVVQAITAASHHRKIAIGVGIGVGVPVIALLVGVIFFHVRRKRYSSVPVTEGLPVIARPTVGRFGHSFAKTKSPVVQEMEELYVADTPGRS